MSDGTVHDLFAHRDSVRAQLATSSIHVLAVLRHPDALASTPIGDLLCWTDGLAEAEVARILNASGISWGRRICLLSRDETARILWQVKQWYPEVWERWRRQALPDAA